VAEAAPLAEEALNETAEDDLATIAATNRVLGEVRAAQGRYPEAEELLRRAAQVISTTEFPGFEPYVALAGFLVRTGRVDEGLEWLAKARDSVRQFPQDSPVGVDQQRRMARIEAEAEARRDSVKGAHD
jgi:hypothetical protein